jgi:hypothetical protein
VNADAREPNDTSMPPTGSCVADTRENLQLLLNYACNMMVTVYEFTICRVIIRF